MYVTVIGIWVVRVGLTRILMSTFNLGLTAAWLAMFMDWMVRATLYIFRLRSGKWKSIRV